MKEELQGKLVEILTSIQTAAGKASDFAMEHLPDIAQSYVLYGRAWSLFEVAACIAAAAACLLMVRWGHREESADKYSANPLPIFGMIVGGVGLIVFAIGTLVAAKSAALVWFAPKVWLLKEIATLIR